MLSENVSFAHRTRIMNVSEHDEGGAGREGKYEKRTDADAA